MNNLQGTIVAIIRDSGSARAIVEVEAAAVCARCASGRGCGAGILAGRTGNRRLEVAIGPEQELAEGDAVGVELAPGNVLRAALIVYGLPLAGATGGAALAYLSALGDGGAVVMAIAGLAGGALISRRRLGGDSCHARFTPSISRRVAPDL
jgi:sigma-E factor negative regulatory protein RseC